MGFSEKAKSKNFGLFFDALQDSLNTLLLSFGNSQVDQESLKSFAKNISSLKKLKSIYLEKFWLIDSVKTSLPCGLEELALKLSDYEGSTTKLFESIFKTTTKLTKVSLKVKSFDKDFDFTKVFSNQVELKDLELVSEMLSKENWKDLIRTLPKFKNLEMLKIARKDEEFSLIDVDLN